MLSSAEHEKSFITLGPGPGLETNNCITPGTDTLQSREASLTRWLSHLPCVPGVMPGSDPMLQQSFLQVPGL